MPDGLLIRPATEQDWPAMWAVLRAILDEGNVFVYDPDTDSEQGRRMWFEPPPSHTWVAEVDGEVVAAYRTGPNRPGPGSHIATCTYMVAAAARGHGAGRAMVVHSLDQARAAGYRGMQFNAVAATNVYAVKLYLDLGFVVIGAIPGGYAHPQDGFVDLLIMYRDLVEA